MESNKIKMVDFEDTFLWKVKIVSINIESINYIEKYSKKKIIFGLKSGGRYYVDASIDNLNTLEQVGLVGVNWLIINYSKKYGLLKNKRLTEYNQSIEKNINKKVFKNDCKNKYINKF